MGPCYGWNTKKIGNLRTKKWVCYTAEKIFIPTFVRNLYIEHKHMYSRNFKNNLKKSLMSLCFNFIIFDFNTSLQHYICSWVLSLVVIQCISVRFSDVCCIGKWLSSHFLFYLYRPFCLLQLHWIFHSKQKG